jgi:thymidylate synthase ThyX/5-methylcytosine-specific restriction endonuclease McrA
VNALTDETTGMTSENTIEVLDHGFLALDGAFASDLAVVNGARVSFNVASEEMGERDEGLIRYLMRDRHGSPFEHGYFRFIVKAPIFVVREHHRHRAGHCLPGSAAIWAETIAPRAGRMLRKRPIAEIYRNWHEGFRDTLGRTRLLPSCRRLSLRVLNEETQLFELGRAADVFKSGTKEIYELRTDERVLRCSVEHRVLTSEGWVRAGDLRRGDQVATSGVRTTRAGQQFPPSLRRGIGVWTSMQRMTRINPIDRCHLCGLLFERDDLVLDHVVPVAADLKLALDVENLAPACKSCHRAKTNDEQKLADRKSKTAGAKYVGLVSNPIRVAEEETYDIEMDGLHHNFVADGVVVHNSYNEWSGRYSKMEAEFYVPDNVRTQIGKPGAYSFEPVEPAVRELAQAEIRTTAEQAFAAYERMLEQGVAKEVARTVLPLSMYTKYFWSCNPRSLMHFCGLRNSEHAQFEIREYARAAESFLEKLMPVTHAAFLANGRVAP